MINSNMLLENEETLLHSISYAAEQLANTEKEIKQPKEDMVNHPPHYTQGEIECIEAIKYINNKLRTEGYEGYCLGNFIKYIWRCNFKNGWEDIDKAIFYLNELFSGAVELKAGEK